MSVVVEINTTYRNVKPSENTRMLNICNSSRSVCTLVIPTLSMTLDVSPHSRQKLCDRMQE